MFTYYLNYVTNNYNVFLELSLNIELYLNFSHVLTSEKEQFASLVKS